MYSQGLRILSAEICYNIDRQPLFTQKIENQAQNQTAFPYSSPTPAYAHTLEIP